jgi:polypeptide N-acetylgalactosaminyltransferase
VIQFTISVTFSIDALIGWLEPLLDRIAEDKRHVVYPQMPNIKDDTLEFKAFSAKNIQVGRFDWQLIFRWMDLPQYINKTRKSFVSPTRCVIFKRYLLSVQFLSGWEP